MKLGYKILKRFIRISIKSICYIFRSSSANSSQLKSEETKNSFIKNLLSNTRKDTNSPASAKVARKQNPLEPTAACQIATKTNAPSTTCSSASPSSTKSSLSSSSNQLSNQDQLEGYYVTFEEFVNAADLVLEKRRKEKLHQLQQQQKQMKTMNNNNSNKKKTSCDDQQFRSNSYLEERKSAKLNKSNIESFDSLKSGN